MSVHLSKVLVPPPVAMPRGARWAASGVTAMVRVGHRVWQALEGVGRARAQRELDRLAVRYANQPEFTANLRDAMHRAAMHRDSSN